MAPTVSLSLLQQGQQITRNDYSWTTLGTPADVTFGFRASTPTIGNEAATFSRFNANEILATRIALQEWTDVANIRFVDAGGNGFTDNATMLFANFNGASTSAGHAYLPINKNTAPTSIEGDSWLNLTSSPYNNFGFGSHQFATIIHEIGHAIGLSHPGDYNAGDEGVPATYQASAQYIQDSLQYTIMSYFFAGNTGASYLAPGGGTIAGSTPGLADIAAAQRLYGAATTTRTGDNIYGFNSNSGEQYRISDVNPQVVFTIYDNGGTNMLDLSGYATNQAIDLRQGEFSNAGALVKNISIALGTVVHNARGGSGNDAILGNASDNAIQGGPGNDVIDGGAGINTAFYSGASGNYIVTLNAGTGLITATVQDKTGVDGTDIITNIQHLRFTDTLVTAPRLGAAASLSDDALAAMGSAHITDLDLTQVLEAASLSPAAFSDLAQVFIASLNRAPDALGFDYWAGRLVEGTSLGEVAAAIASSDEARTLLPATLGAGEFVTAAYFLTFGRAPDAAGLAYWQTELQAGRVPHDTFILDLVMGAKTAGSAQDRGYLANRAEVGEHFALTKGINDLLQAVTVMSDVDGNRDSVSRAIELVDKFAAADALASDELIVAITGIVP
jgi:serralysin